MLDSGVSWPADAGDAAESSDYHRRAMTDQLSLRLDAALPNPPSNLRPMLARPLPEPFDSPDHLFEPSWGGRRTIAIVGPAEVAGAGEVTLVDDQGSALRQLPPELAGLAVRLAARSAILDGELVVVDGSGRADPAELARRLAGEPGRPVAYLAFDLLHLDGRSLLNVPLEKRRDLMRRILRPADEVLVVPAIPGEGRALFSAVAAQGLPGILARQRTSPYLPGVRSRLWRFIAVSPPAARPGEPTLGLTDPGEPESPGSGPVLALIRRLPLGFDPPSDAG